VAHDNKKNKITNIGKINEYLEDVLIINTSFSKKLKKSPLEKQMNRKDKNGYH